MRIKSKATMLIEKWGYFLPALALTIWYFLLWLIYYQRQISCFESILWGMPILIASFTSFVSNLLVSTPINLRKNVLLTLVAFFLVYGILPFVINFKDDVEYIAFSIVIFVSTFIPLGFFIGLGVFLLGKFGFQLGKKWHNSE